MPGARYHPTPSRIPLESAHVARSSACSLPQPPALRTSGRHSAEIPVPVNATTDLARRRPGLLHTSVSLIATVLTRSSTQKQRSVAPADSAES